VTDLRPVDPRRDAPLARELLRLQHAAYAVEAALIGDDRIPTLTETVEELRAAPLTWLAAYGDGVLLGAVAWTGDPAGVDIDRLVVDPAAHRRGVGTALVRAVLADAAGRAVTVSTGRANAPARTLYERLGFRRTADTEVVPGLWVTGYAHPGPA
jgi:ribosomal protein S18 acetylase RimI-like enzyme